MSEPGINGSPAWSPDGKYLAVTLSFKINPDIYIIDLGSGVRRRLTDVPSIETEAAWSPDGSAIAFTSDRSGPPQIYQVPMSGGEPQLLTKTGRQNLRACYSSDGKRITFVSGQSGAYKIAVMDLATGDTKIISEGPVDMSPSFSPDGLSILYVSLTQGIGELKKVSLDGSQRASISVPAGFDVREPAWAAVSQ